MTRTPIFALRNDLANRKSIGYHATRQNVAVGVLNREPELLKRSNKSHPYVMNKYGA